MKMDFGQKIKDLLGNETDLMLGNVAAEVLNIPVEDGNPLKNDEACKRGSLAMKVAKCSATNVEPAEIALIQRLLPLCGRPNFVVAQANEMLRAV